MPYYISSITVLYKISESIHLCSIPSLKGKETSLSSLTFGSILQWKAQYKYTELDKQSEVKERVQGDTNYIYIDLLWKRLGELDNSKRCKFTPTKMKESISCWNLDIISALKITWGHIEESYVGNFLSRVHYKWFYSFYLESNQRDDPE